MRTIKKANHLRTLQYIFFGSILLYLGQSLLIPLSIALLISFILYPICTWLERKSFKRVSAILISMSLLTLFVGSILALLIKQFMSFLVEWPAFKLRLTESANEVSLYLLETFNISKDQQTVWVKQVLDQSGGNLFLFIQHTIATYGYTVVLMILVPIFAMLLLYYRRKLIHVVFRLFPMERRADINSIFQLTIHAYYNFIKGMVIVYLVVGTLNSIGLLLLGVPYAIVFGFIAAILTFIPYVGIMVGSLLPITMAWVTYNSVWYPIGVVLIFAFVQYLEANLIFPLAVSNRLKINALATLCAILLGGIIWGVAGMILFVPFLAITKLIMDKYPRFKTWSTLLGNN